MQFSFCCSIFCFNRAGLSAEQITYKWLNSFIRVLNIGSQGSWKIKRGEMNEGRERKGDEGRWSSFTWRILNYARENFWVTRWRKGKLNRMNTYIRVHNKWMEHFPMFSLLIDLSCPRFLPLPVTTFWLSWPTLHEYLKWPSKGQFGLNVAVKSLKLHIWEVHSSNLDTTILRDFSGFFSIATGKIWKTVKLATTASVLLLSKLIVFILLSIQVMTFK